MKQTNLEWPEQLKTLQTSASECTKCSLRSDCIQVVFGSGSPNAKVMFIGDFPGKQEDSEGKPFVGPSGQLLKVIINKMKIAEDQVYVTNLIKCKPNRKDLAEKEHFEACRWIIDKEIEIVDPKVIVALGYTVANSLRNGRVREEEDRGLWTFYKGIPVMYTYHPADILYHETFASDQEIAAVKWDIWTDIKVAMTNAMED